MTEIFNEIDKINWSDYEMLLGDDRKMIDEYMTRMTAVDLNLFMRRLIEHYNVEEELEVKEDIDAILVFERSKVFQNADYIKTALTYESIDAFFVKQFLTSKSDMMKVLAEVISAYFSNKRKQSGDSVWIVDEFADGEIKDLYSKFAIEKKIGCIQIDAMAILRCYRYRAAAGIEYTRLGLAIDKKVLHKTKRDKVGYGQNYKMPINFINIGVGSRNITQYVKTAGYWTPTNAIASGFDDKTGVIWFDGVEVTGGKWQFPDNSVIDIGSIASVNATCFTDGFTKMMQRFNFASKVQELIASLENK